MRLSRLASLSLISLPLLAGCGDSSSPVTEEPIGSAEAALVNAPGQVLVGSLSNFDAVNDTGEVAHGFEIDCDGISAADIYRIFGYWFGANIIRYGAGVATDYPGGTSIRWTSSYDPATQTYAQGTPVPASLATFPGHSCFTLGMGAAYPASGCEHFGISAYKNPTATTYHWLIDDPQNPGTLIKAPNAVSLPAPVWQVFPPAQVGAPPVVAAAIVAPPPPVPVVPPPIPQFGDAQWVKVYKTENANQVALEDLVGGNAAVVPQDPAQLEVSWSLLQLDPPGEGGNGKHRGKLVNQGGMNGGSRAVVRRYEHYKFSGTYDAVTHEAICGGDGLCNAPVDGELGDVIGAQNAAANVVAPAITVTKVGNGNVSSSDGLVSCGSKCQSFYDAGTSVTLTAGAGSGSVFTGWSGACAGAALTCVLSVNDALDVTATFADVVTLSTSVKGSGAITGTPAGNDRAINCGNACTAKFTSGTSVVLTATPAAGKAFVNWSGGCSGTAPTCALQVSKTTGNVIANFTK